jgi:hypothetical protein
MALENRRSWIENRWFLRPACDTNEGGSLQETHRRHMKTHTLNSFVLALASAACWWPCAGQAVTPTEYELGEAARWTAAKFKAATDTGKPGAGLYVLANNDPVQLTAILVAILVGPRHSGRRTTPFGHSGRTTRIDFARSSWVDFRSPGDSMGRFSSLKIALWSPGSPRTVNRNCVGERFRMGRFWAAKSEP